MAKETYSRISEEAYKKLVFQLRGQYIAILSVFRCYGLDRHVDQSIDECVKVAENFGMAVRGKNKPIHILDKPKKKATEE